MVAIFKLFVVLHKAAVRSPMENMETSVMSHAPIKIAGFPSIRYQKTITADAATKTAEIADITPLHKVSAARMRAGLAGLQ